jgi:hypothetical protein
VIGSDDLGSFFYLFSHRCDERCFEKFMQAVKPPPTTINAFLKYILFLFMRERADVDIKNHILS